MGGDMGRSVVMTRLLYIVSHPIQYQAPLLRRVATEPGIELRVLFERIHPDHRYFDTGFGRDVKWDIDLTDGYDYTSSKPTPLRKYEKRMSYGCTDGNRLNEDRDEPGEAGGASGIDARRKLRPRYAGWTGLPGWLKQFISLRSALRSVSRHRISKPAVLFKQRSSRRPDRRYAVCRG